jgi:peptidoglycan/xylan/chitin deacetylase (PgdA/CDA1 family)
MSAQITELSDKVVVIQSDRYFEPENIERLMATFKKYGFKVIWLNP